MNLSKEADVKIRNALKDADKKGKLGVVAAVTSIAGGEERLKEIMNSEDELSIMDRGMLGMHIVIENGHSISCNCRQCRWV